MSPQPSLNNHVVLACAGGRKTTGIVAAVVAHRDRRVLVTTYTNENLDQLTQCFIRHCGCVPANVTLVTWFSFLLNECVRPYQPAVTNAPRINSLFFDRLPQGLRYVAKTDADRYYLTSGNNIYSERTAEFACAADDASGGKVIGRLEQLFDAIYIDELQDLASYDQIFLDKLFKSRVAMTCVGDPRQATYATNHGRRNSQFRGEGIVDWLNEVSRAAQLSIEHRSESYRCNQQICDFADALWPDMPRTVSVDVPVTAHDGIFLITRADVESYVREHRPVVLRYSKATKRTMGLPSINFGLSKGRTYDRVLIFPTAGIRRYLDTRAVEDAGDIPKFYVAVTRARFSVAFVLD